MQSSTESLSELRAEPEKNSSYSSPNPVKSQTPPDQAQESSFAHHLEKMSGLRTWLIWLVVLITISALIGVAFLLEKPGAQAAGDTQWSLIELAMYSAIIGLGVSLIIKGFIDAKYIQQETQLASRHLRVLENVENFDEFLMRTQMQPSLFSGHIENLYSISQHSTDFTQDNLIQLLHQRLSVKNNTVELFSSILITLGLIGTIIGLIIMMDGLSVVLQSPDDLLAQLANPVDGPLSGLGTAFYTTLLGAAFGGVILRVLGNVIDNNITSYVAYIAEITEVHVLPFMRSVAEKRLQVAAC